MDGKDIKIFSCREDSVLPLSTAEFRNGKHHHQHLRLPGRGIGIAQHLWICPSTTPYSTLSLRDTGRKEATCRIHHLHHHSLLFFSFHPSHICHILLLIIGPTFKMDSLFRFSFLYHALHGLYANKRKK